MVLFDNEKVSKKWKDFTEGLYERKDVEENVHIEKDEDEFERALMEMSDRKAAGVDEIPTEIVKCLDEGAKNSLFNILTTSYAFTMQSLHGIPCWENDQEKDPGNPTSKT